MSGWVSRIFSVELMPKRLELLKEPVPRARRIAVPSDPEFEPAPRALADRLLELAKANHAKLVNG